MRLTKKVNGTTIPLSPQEEKEIKERWKKWETEVPEKIKTNLKLKKFRQYPSVEERLEAIFLALEELQKNGTILPPQTQECIEKISLINSKFA
jgi:hypothetical protein